MNGWASAVTAAQLFDGQLYLWVIDVLGKVWSASAGYPSWSYWQSAWTDPPPAVSNMAAAPLSDKRLKFWTVDTSCVIWSCQQAPAPNTAAVWTPWISDWASHATAFRAAQILAAPLSDGRLQFWAVDTDGSIWSCWQLTTSSDSAWSEWTTTWTSTPTPARVAWIAVAPLSDGRLQFWAVNSVGEIWSCWKETISSEALWMPWTNAWTPNAPPFRSNQVTAASLSDGSLQLWAVDAEGGGLWSCRRSGASGPPIWTDWTMSWIADIPEFMTSALWPFRVADDGRLALFIVDAEGQMRVTVMSGGDSESPWGYWCLLFPMQKQEQTNWCWSGCATAASHFYNPASAWTQCSLANAELGKTTCCTDPAPCNVYGYLKTALTTVGNLASMIEGTQTEADIISETAAGRPLGVRIGWRGGGGHFVMVNGGAVMVTGGVVTEWVTVKDPWYGTFTIPYSTLVNSYHGFGSWTHSYLTQPTQP